ncbi:hypothetical protein ACEZ3G_16625 [Maribacter algicola]|uniref:Uncharacterized protein n=1 Tax=Meishania litoralis TaxID=3434685 RepID=A0ACC7LQD9_9FLAO
MSNFGKNDNFKIPKDYFDEFKYKLMAKLNEEDSGPSFSDAYRDSGFIVPKNYFETLNERVAQKADAEKSKVVRLHPYRQYYIAAASVAAILVVALSVKLTTTKTPDFETLGSYDIENYLENHDIDFSDNELAELLPMQEVRINDILNQEINQEGIEDYLDQTIEDVQELNNVYDEE